MIDQLLLFIASLIANTMSAFAGGGAGLVQFPVLIFLGLPFSVALATHKTASVALGIGATYRYLSKRDSSFEWGFASYALLCGILGTVLGAYIIVRIPDHIAELSLGIITVALGLYSVFKPSFGQDYAPKNRTLAGYATGGIALLLIGIFNGSLTSGSGLFVTLLFILWFGLDYKRAVMYTLILVGLFWNGAGAVSVNAFGSSTYWAWIPVLLVAATLGGYVGSHMAMKHGSNGIKRGFEAVTLISGFYLIIRFFT